MDLRVPLGDRADHILRKIRRLGPEPILPEVHGRDLLLERALINRFRFIPGQTAAGTCRLLSTCDGVIAVNLPRADDWQLVNAWLESDRLDDPGCVVATNLLPGTNAVKPDHNDLSLKPWNIVSELVSSQPSNYLLDRARELGLAVAAADLVPTGPTDFYHNLFRGSPVIRHDQKPPRVVDLSALWAGPLCSHLLQLLGAEVIKVESTGRPDGAREGNQEFYALLNQAKRSVALDLKSVEGIKALRQLLATADIVIESSRPRALLQLGINPREFVRNIPGITWIQITGHGSEAPVNNWIGYGDDAAAAAGLSALLYKATGNYGFVGDAIADPLTGLHAGLVAWQSWRNGGGKLLALSLRGVTSYCLHKAMDDERSGFAMDLKSWPNSVGLLNRNYAGKKMSGSKLIQHSVRLAQGGVASLGEHTIEVMKEVHELSL